MSRFWLSISTHFSHTLTGVWVEMTMCYLLYFRLLVTPSRVCELKYSKAVCYPIWKRSHPHGCVSWNETVFQMNVDKLRSHPHGCVSWNLLRWLKRSRTGRHTLTGVWVEIPHKQQEHSSSNRHTLTGVWVEIHNFFKRSPPSQSHPHGCVSWN